MSSHPFFGLPYLPIYTPSFLSDPEDRKKLARGLRLGVRIALSEPLNSVIDSTDPNPHLDHVLLNQSDEELEKFVQQWVVTVYHPVGSCSMKPLKSGGVVDSKLRVYGVKGLRVGDVSVLPNAISGHTVGPFLHMCAANLTCFCRLEQHSLLGSISLILSRKSRIS